MRTKAIAVLTICASLAFCASSQAKIQKLRANDPKYQYNLGLFHLNQNNVDEAIKYFVKSLSLDARFYQAWNMLGLAHASRGRFDEAVKAFQKSLEINPQFTEVYNNLGTVYQEMGFLDMSENAYKTALADPAYANRESPYYNMARLYVLQNRLDEALDNANKAVAAKPRFAMAHDLKGLIQEKLGNLDEAIVSYETAVKIVPEEVRFSYNLAVACFNAGDYARSKELFLKISGKVTDAASRDTIANYLKMIREKGEAGS
jgi:Flp pilus assembly protein TadD